MQLFYLIGEMMLVRHPASLLAASMDGAAENSRHSLLTVGTHNVLEKSPEPFCEMGTTTYTSQILTWGVCSANEQ